MPEIIEMRTRSSKTHSLGGGRSAWDGVIGAGAIHYKDNGWQNIDNIFEPALAPWDWEMVRAGYHVRVKENFAAYQILEFEVERDGVLYCLRLQPHALELTCDSGAVQPVSMPQSVPPVVTNPLIDLLPAVGMLSHLGSITWIGAYGEGMDFEWQCQPSRLVKRLKIGSLLDLPDPQQHIIDGGNPVLRLNLIFEPPSKQDVDIVVDGQVWDQQSSEQTFNTIEFVKNGDVLWGLMPLRYWDSNGSQGQSVATLERSGDRLHISIRVPYSWLQTASYPVFIDTDVDEQVPGGTSDADQTAGGTMNLTRDRINMGDIVGTTYHAGYRFETVNVPQGADLTTSPNSYLTFLTLITDGGGLSYTWFGHKIASAGVFTSAASNISGRDRTTASVTENPPAAWTNGVPVNSVDISAVLEEIFSVGNSWVTGNNLAMLSIYNSGTGERLPESYENAPGDSAKLHIEYAAVGWAGGDVSGVPIANIAKINGVALADILKVNGVA